MREIFCCLCFLLPACASHSARCDGHLLPINLPTAAGAMPSASAPASSSELARTTAMTTTAVGGAESESSSVSASAMTAVSSPERAP